MGGFYDLPVFRWYLGTCSDQKEFTKITKIAKSCFEIFVSYLCLNGTWVFVSVENRLENGF